MSLSENQPSETLPVSPELQGYRNRKRQLQESESELKVPSAAETPAFVGEYAERITQISGSWNPVEIYTADPDNLAEEREAFFEAFEKGETYHPTFKYPVAEAMGSQQGKEGLAMDESRQELRAILRELDAMEIDRGDKAARLARMVLRAKVKDDLATCDLVQGIGTKDEVRIKQAINQKYAPLDPYLTEAAHRQYVEFTQPRPEKKEEVGRLVSDEEEECLKAMQLSSEEIAEAFRWGLEKLGVNVLAEGEEGIGFHLVVSEAATYIDVRDKSANGPTIFVPAKRDTPLNGVAIMELLDHEIGAHVRQSVNGQMLFGGLGGGLMKVDDETLYEGLAMRTEAAYHKRFYNKVDDEYPVFPYVLAVEEANTGASFQEIVASQLEVRLRLALKVAPDQPLPDKESLAPGVYEKARNMAWRTTYRIMRGHTDTSNEHAFAMTKDLGYFRGALLDQELVDAGLGHINEAAVLKSGGLRAMAYFKLDTLPIPPQDLSGMYWEEVLKPKVRQGLSETDLEKERQKIQGL